MNEYVLIWGDIHDILHLRKQENCNTAWLVSYTMLGGKKQSAIEVEALAKYFALCTVHLPAYLQLGRAVVTSYGQ